MLRVIVEFIHVQRLVRATGQSSSLATQLTFVPTSTSRRSQRAVHNRANARKHSEGSHPLIFRATCTVFSIDYMYKHCTRTYSTSLARGYVPASTSACPAGLSSSAECPGGAHAGMR
eukprot:5964642-Prymnesium_polylepis.1